MNTFRALAVILMAAASFSAQAQLHRCIDERGRTQYTDKPLPGCKPVAGTAPAPAPAAPKAAKGVDKAGTKAAAGKGAKKAVMTREEREKFAAECKVLQEQLDWLNGPRGSKVEAHAARVGQVKQAMRGCP